MNHERERRVATNRLDIFPIYTLQQIRHEYEKSDEWLSDINRAADHADELFKNTNISCQIMAATQTQWPMLIADTYFMAEHRRTWIDKKLYGEYRSWADKAVSKTMIFPLATVAEVQRRSVERFRKQTPREISAKLETESLRELSSKVKETPLFPHFIGKLKALWRRRSLRKAIAKRDELEKKLTQQKEEGITINSILTEFARNRSQEKIIRMIKKILSSETIQEISSKRIQLEPLSLRQRIIRMYAVGLLLTLGATSSLPTAIFIDILDWLYLNRLASMIDKQKETVELLPTEIEKIANNHVMQAIRGNTDLPDKQYLPQWMNSCTFTQKDLDKTNPGEAFLQGLYGNTLSKSFQKPYHNEPEDIFHRRYTEAVTAHRLGLTTRARITLELLDFLEEQTIQTTQPLKLPLERLEQEISKGEKQLIGIIKSEDTQYYCSQIFMFTSTTLNNIMYSVNEKLTHLSGRPTPETTIQWIVKQLTQEVICKQKITVQNP